MFTIARMMKKYGVACLIACLCVSAAGIFTLAENSETEESADTLLCALEPGEQVQSYIANFLWCADQPMNFMRSLGAAANMTSPDIATLAGRTRVHLLTQEGRLYARLIPEESSASEPSHVNRSIELLRSFERRQPDGTRHVIRHLLLICEVPSPDEGDPAVFLQQFEVDATLGSVDAMPCSTPARYAHLPTKDCICLTPSGLPEKYNGAPLRQDMLRLLYAIAAIDSQQMAKGVAAELSSFAWQLAAKAPSPEKNWPHCWDSLEKDARTIARHLAPTLLYLQEHNCFDCVELVTFINSPQFSRIFGNDFSKLPDKPVQDDILYERQ